MKAGIFVLCSFCVVGLLTYAHRVAEAEDSVSQKNKLSAQKETPEHGFSVQFNQSGVVQSKENVSFLGENVFANPEVSTIFHKAAGRALRGGGYTRFLWPDENGEVKLHVAYSFMDKDTNVVMMAEPKK